MSKCVQLITTDNQIACVNLDKVLYATQYSGHIRLAFGDSASLCVRISMNDFYNLMTGKAK